MENANKNKQLGVNDLHLEHKSWRKELSFWKDEIISFRHRILEKNSTLQLPSSKAELEHFYTQFSIHENMIIKLLESIGELEYHLAFSSKNYPELIKDKTFVDHVKHREEFEMEKKLFVELKQRFYKFLLDCQT